MRLWGRFKHPLKNVWLGVAARLGIRKSGLLKLQHDVRRCEYDDVHVMWEMLERNEREISQSSRRIKERSFWSIFWMGSVCSMPSLQLLIDMPESLARKLSDCTLVKYLRTEKRPTRK